ncbi:MAG: putative 2-aminoethylphosphonate ABC transporter ATP-binding protein [Rubrivivax sp.]|nr:putative 2-aminoethylphosphonate ABC transporter ATP-binding protein [Rubrivivax sp.]
MAPPPFLKLEGVHKQFGSFTALGSVDLAIDKGEFVCFLGPSGCGKTTLLRIIAGLEAQTAGRIEQAGRDISTAPPAERDYGIVFQSYALFPNLTVADNVAYGLVNRKVGRAEVRSRVAELVKLVGLPGSEAKFPAQLSGGQQQRIALARALATSPGLLLLDEPLSALDAIVRVHLRQEIRSLQRKLGVTTIMVTHDQEEALSVADRIVVMNQGTVEQVGTPMAVYREPASPFVADFVGRVNVLEGTAEAGERVRIGPTLFECTHGRPRGTKVRIYLRPEDVLARTGTGGPAASAVPARPVPAEVSAGGGEAPAPAGADSVFATAVFGSRFALGDPNTFEAEIEKIEFLGSYCLVRVTSAALGEQKLTAYLSLNYLSEQQLQVGSRLPVRLMRGRMRVFA